MSILLPQSYHLSRRVQGKSGNLDAAHGSTMKEIRGEGRDRSGRGGRKAEG